MINENIYGSSASQIQKEGSIKIANFGETFSGVYTNSSIWYGQKEGFLHFGEELEESITQGIMDDNNDIARLNTIYITSQGASGTQYATYCEDSVENPFFLSYPDNLRSQLQAHRKPQTANTIRNDFHGNSGNTPHNWGAFNTLYTGDNANISDCWCAPITSYNYKDIVWLIVVDAKSTTTQTTTVAQTYDLNTYCTTGFLSTPYISAIRLIPFVKQVVDGVSIYKAIPIALNHNRIYDMIDPQNENKTVKTMQFDINGDYRDSGGTVYDGASHSVGTTGLVLGMSTYLQSVRFAGNKNSDVAYWFGERFKIQLTGTYFHTLYTYSNGSTQSTTANITEFKEYCLRQCAYLGMFFTPSISLVENLATSNAFNNENMYIGIVEADGYTKGNYTHGNDNEDSDQYNWNNPFNDNTRYDPYDPTKNKNDKMILNNPKISPLTSFNKCYAISGEGLNWFSQWLWYNGADNWVDSLVHYSLNNNPIDCIISVKCFPFDVLEALNLSVEYENIKVGNTNTGERTGGVDYKYGVNLQPAETTRVLLDLGSFKINLPNVFTSYAPYKTATLYIPYCDTIDIPLKQFNGHKLSVKMIVDLITGACSALVYNDDTLYTTINGICASDVSITGRNNADYSKQLVSNASKTASAGASIATGLALATSVTNPVGAIGAFGTLTGGIIAGASAVHDTKCNAPEIMATGNATGVIGYSQPQYCYLTYKTYEPINTENYEHLVGYACNVSKQLSDFSGFTQFSNVNLSGVVGATKEEIDEIRSGLQQGVYL